MLDSLKGNKMTNLDTYIDQHIEKTTSNVSDSEKKKTAFLLKRLAELLKEHNNN
jgi:hypothetical protein|tara:strand:- start:323 stop:484 length:162 start_codon:yes stop_codon:yes gene_type:complete